MEKAADVHGSELRKGMENAGGEISRGLTDAGNKRLYGMLGLCGVGLIWIFVAKGG